MIKKFIITLCSFIGTILISFYFYFFLLAMLALSTDSGAQSMSVYILGDFSFVFFFSLFIGCVGMIPHVIAFILYSTKINKSWFSKKMYLCLQGMFFIFIFIIAFSLHGSFSKEVYTKRILEIKQEQGFITENSNIYILCNKYLHFNNEKEIKAHIQYDKIILNRDFDEIVGRLYVITNTDFDEIYRKLNISKSEIIREDLQREMILKIFNDFENDDIAINEFKEELNKVLESKIEEGKYDSNIAKEYLRVSIQTDLVYLNRTLNSGDFRAELYNITWLTESLQIWIEEEYDYNTDLVNSDIYKDYLNTLSKNNSIEELKTSMNSFSEKYNIDYNDKDINEIISKLDRSL